MLHSSSMLKQDKIDHTFQLPKNVQEWSHMLYNPQKPINNT